MSPVRGRPLVLHVLEAIESGTSRHLVDLVRTATRTQHVVVVPKERVGGSTDFGAASEMRTAGGEVVFVPMTRSPLTAVNARAIASLRHLIHARHPDVVHGHSSVGGLLARVAGLGTGAALVYTPHAVAAGRVARTAEQLLGRFTDVFVAVSATEAAEARRSLVGSERVVEIPNGIELAPPAPASLRHLLGVNDGVPIVGTMGRLAAQKAPEVFLAAAEAIHRSHPAVRFVQIGTGPDANAYARRVARSAIGEKFYQIASLPKASRYLGDLSVFVLTSRFEGGPYAPLEAIRAGVPVVLTDVVGNADVIEHERSGLLVPVDDAEATARAVVRVLDDVVLQRQLTDAASLRLRDRFDVREMGRAHDALYQRLAEST